MTFGYECHFKLIKVFMYHLIALSVDINRCFMQRKTHKMVKQCIVIPEQPIPMVSLFYHLAGKGFQTEGEFFLNWEEIWSWASWAKSLVKVKVLTHLFFLPVKSYRFIHHIPARKMVCPPHTHTHTKCFFRLQHAVVNWGPRLHRHLSYLVMHWFFRILITQMPYKKTCSPKELTYIFRFTDKNFRFSDSKMRHLPVMTIYLAQISW